MAFGISTQPTRDAAVRVSWRRRPAGGFATSLNFKNRRRDAGATIMLSERRRGTMDPMAQLILICRSLRTPRLVRRDANAILPRAHRVAQPLLAVRVCKPHME